MATAKKILATWTEVGPWHKGNPAPNGSVPGGPERVSTTLVLYEADYYGKGAKKYLSGKSTLHYVCMGAVCLSPAFGFFDDGNEDRIAARMAAAGVY